MPSDKQGIWVTYIIWGEGDATASCVLNGLAKELTALMANCKSQMYPRAVHRVEQVAGR
nr:MAG TPA: hypothetical protein [Caudoviricetes sp.]